MFPVNDIWFRITNDSLKNIHFYLGHNIFFHWKYYEQLIDIITIDIFDITLMHIEYFQVIDFLLIVLTFVFFIIFIVEKLISGISSIWSMTYLLYPLQWDLFRNQLQLRAWKKDIFSTSFSSLLPLKLKKRKRKFPLTPYLLIFETIE